MSDSAATADPPGTAGRPAWPSTPAPRRPVPRHLAGGPGASGRSRAVAARAHRGRLSGRYRSLTVDRIDDLRQCVQEALSLLLVSDGSGDLRLCYQATRGCARDRPEGLARRPDRTCPCRRVLLRLADAGRTRHRTFGAAIDGALRVSFVIEASR